MPALQPAAPRRRRSCAGAPGRTCAARSANRVAASATSTASSSSVPTSESASSARSRCTTWPSNTRCAVNGCVSSVVRRAAASRRSGSRCQRPSSTRSDVDHLAAAGSSSRPSSSSAWDVARLDVVGVEQRPPRDRTWLAATAPTSTSATSSCSAAPIGEVDPRMEGAAGRPEGQQDHRVLRMEAEHHRHEGDQVGRGAGDEGGRSSVPRSVPAPDGRDRSRSGTAADGGARRRSRVHAKRVGAAVEQANRRSERTAPVDVAARSPRCAPSRRSCTWISMPSSPRWSSATSPRCAASRSSSAASADAASWRPRPTRRAPSGCTRRCRPPRPGDGARNAAFLSGRFHAYRDTSRAGDGAAASISPLVEPLSLDEAFVDLEAADLPDHSVASVSALGRELKERVHEVTGGLTGSVGIGTSKLVAKIASDLDKPDGLVVVAPGAWSRTCCARCRSRSSRASGRRPPSGCAGSACTPSRSSSG